MGAKEFYINVGDKKIEAFIYDGFLESRMSASSLHSHRYTEIHFTSRGKCIICACERELSSSEGTVTAIPQGMLHRLMSFDDDTYHLAFLINYQIEDVVQTKVSAELLRELGDLIATYEKHKKFDSIANYLSFISGDIVCSETELRRVTNREFLITEFFANRYNEDISIGDIASELNVSEKQASRLIKKHMGATFSDVLSDYRLQAANRLLFGTSEMSLTEVAEFVGYRSYSGFWKAFKRYNKQ